jgi:hypothetical protein
MEHPHARLRNERRINTAVYLAKGGYDHSMKTDYVLMGVLVLGAALTCFYLVAECLSWRTVKDADHRAMREIRELYKKIHSATKPFTRTFAARTVRRK